ncbi:MAG: hypothetical protein L0H29_10135 [Sinobacteraceae bacterium]|nr:hypothetical protein [Nevskiaceae bacterium]
MSKPVFQGLTVLALACAVVALILAVRGNGGMTSGGKRIVTVDLVRVMNAERATLPSLLGSGGGVKPLSLLRVGHELMPTIEKMAGPDTVVLVKQAVVGGQLPDITTAVLKKLGLPEHAPTIDLSKMLSDHPTSASAKSGAQWAGQVRQHQAQQKAYIKSAQKKKADARLP